MLHTPSSTKYKYNFHRYPSKKQGNKGSSYVGGLFELKAKQSYLFRPELVEIIRRMLNKKVKDSGGSLNIRIFPYYSCSKKPLQSRMGKGKGRPTTFVQPIYRGQTLVSLHTRIELHKLKKNLHRLKMRLPILVKEKKKYCFQLQNMMKSI